MPASNFSNKQQILIVGDIPTVPELHRPARCGRESADAADRGQPALHESAGYLQGAVRQAGPGSRPPHRQVLRTSGYYSGIKVKDFMLLLLDAASTA